MWWETIVNKLNTYKSIVTDMMTKEEKKSNLKILLPSFAGSY